MISKILYFVVFIVLSLTVNVASQTCENMTQYGLCSSNSACGCLPITISDDIGICALLGVSCSRLSRCQLPDNTCEKANHICVLHPRCDSSPLCYPMTMIDQKLCPTITPSNTTRPSIIVISNYSSELTTDDGIFIRPLTSSGGYYYESIQVIVSTTGTYNLTSLSYIDTYGFLYNGNFNLLYTNSNLIAEDDEAGGNNQFKLTAFLEAGVPYTLVVTTYRSGDTGPFSIIASGPDDVYFIPINVSQSTTISPMTTSTFFYSNYSNPWPTTTSQSPSGTFVTSNYSNPWPMTTSEYPSPSGTFVTSNYSDPWPMTTSASPSPSGTFFTSNYSNPWPMTTSESPSNTSVISNYYDELTINSERESSTNKYYQSIEILVNTSGYYDLSSLSNMDTYGCLYRGIYDPSYVYSNEIACNDDYGSDRQFKISSFLEAGVLYTLKFTTYGPSVTGPFTVVGSGPDNINFTPVNTLQITSTTTSSSTTSETYVYSGYSSALTVNHDKYSRDGNSTSDYYFESIEIMVNRTGTYTFTSQGSLDAYGYLYQSTFYPFAPSYNLIIEDDQNGGANQFQFSAFLEAGVPYTLVYTTYLTDQTGPFSISALGPDYVHFTPINTLQTTSTNFPWSTTTTAQPTSVTSSYSSALTVNSGTFIRDGNSTSSYYYEALQLNVNTTGIYTFISKSNVDTYGYIYQEYFYPSYPSFNIRVQDDDSNGGGQFRMTTFLQSDVTYILVVTTFSGGITGSFAVEALGPDNVNIIPINNA